MGYNKKSAHREMYICKHFYFKRRKILINNVTFYYKALEKNSKINLFKIIRRKNIIKARLEISEIENRKNNRGIQQN